ncbi:MAG: hypothetical protein JF603_14015 [Acidobacteria bacterium]|nr:hypothetical protein [Acidobacteriota bacterium]
MTVDTSNTSDVFGTSTASVSRNPQLIGIVALVVAIVALGFGFMGAGSSEPNMAADFDAKADNGLYQAVTLTNGTVYYAKIGHKGGALVLTDVYYLTGATAQNPSGSLVKRGAEIHAPTGDMVLNPDVVLQVDNVGKTSIIARGIARIKEGGTATTTTTAAPATTTTAAP